MNTVLLEDIKAFSRLFTLGEKLDGSRFLITGATGLIGFVLVKCLLSLNGNISITCPVRDLSKAKRMFGDDFEKVGFVETDLLAFLSSLQPGDVYSHIVHCASPTDGRFISEHPVETFELAYESTRSILQYAAKAGITGMVYVSSLEYYGQNADDRIIKEDFCGYVDNNSARSSYPLGKRAAEYLCVAYAQERNVPVRIARLTQTFGAGVSAGDNRVFSQFARSIVNGDAIVLHTTGESAKPYCYTIDSIIAILYILLLGSNGEAYNVANEDTYITIRDMALYLCEQFNPSCKVRFEPHPERGYAPVTKLNLDNSKLRTLGWKPNYDLRTMFERLIRSISSEMAVA